jgi:hypothetical protein
MTKNAVRAIATLLLSTLMALAEPIERHEVFAKDGDTVIIGPGVEGHAKEQEYRLVGFDTPETTRGKCPAEIEKGNRATARLIALLDTGKIELTEVECSCPPGKKALTKDCQCRPTLRTPDRQWKGRGRNPHRGGACCAIHMRSASCHKVQALPQAAKPVPITGQAAKTSVLKLPRTVVSLRIVIGIL